ncbi:transcription factor IIF subunit tfg1 [Coemansia guatemalensis]|uniref:Transcription factor IIF subunit tfg1 n=1 Tax=Coemansia guatemalensis TaxID=2761395 RepID=A0A9W8LQM2_9FUNG|nr:transcription factor IIF subunit tfg1 [Coemansia guatemalensis]
MAGQAQQQPSLVEYEVDDLASDPDEDDDGSGRRRKKQGSSSKHGGMEEIEFEMEFDDDEELGDVRFEFNEEEENEKKERMGKEHTSMFGSDDEGEEDVGRAHGSKELDKDAKAVRKLMRKREGNNEYESDREENPYLSESELDSDESDEETEPAKEQDQQQQQQAEKTSGTPDAGAQQKQEQQTPRPGASAAVAAGGSTSSSAKKRKRLSAAPHQHHQHHGAKATGASASGGAASQGGSEPRKHFKASGSSSSKSAASSTLITKQDIVDLIRNGVSTTKELIGHVRKKLKANPENKSRIQAILKEVATFKNNQLALKKP